VQLTRSIDASKEDFTENNTRLTEKTYCSLAVGEIKSVLDISLDSY